MLRQWVKCGFKLEGMNDFNSGMNLPSVIVSVRQCLLGN